MHAASTNGLNAATLLPTRLRTRTRFLLRARAGRTWWETVPPQFRSSAARTVASNSSVSIGLLRKGASLGTCPTRNARRLDKPGYLREALRTYRSLEFLGQHAVPGDRVLGVQICSVAYAPQPWLFECVFMGLDRPTKAQLAMKLEEKPYRYVILPVDLSPEAIAAEFDGQELFRDAHFAVVRLTPEGRRTG